MDRPLFTAILFFFMDFGIMAVWNISYLARGIRNATIPGPRGHLSFYMVVIFDAILLPIVGYTTALLYKTAIDMGLGSQVFNISIEATSIIVAFVTILIHPIILDYKKTAKDWTYVARAKDWKIITLGLRPAGWWHTFCIFFFAQYFSYFFLVAPSIQGFTPKLHDLYVKSILLLSIALILAVIDTWIANRPQYWPNNLVTSLIFKRRINI